MKPKKLDLMKVLTVVAIIMIIILVVTFTIDFLNQNKNSAFSSEQKQEILDSLNVDSSGLSKNEQAKVLNSLKADTNITEEQKETIMNSLKVK